MPAMAADLLSYLLHLIPLLVIPVVLLRSRSSSSRGHGGRRLPPGPWALPIIGHLHHLIGPGGGLPHRRMRDLARRHGRLMLLRLGEVQAVVASSAEAAREIMKTHDVVFAARPMGPLARLWYRDSGGGVVFAPYGDGWRQLRKICTVELLSSRRVRALRPVREAEVGRLLRSVAAAAAPVNLTTGIAVYVLDSTVRAIVGSRPFMERNEYLQMFKDVTTVLPGMGLPDLFLLGSLTLSVPVVAPRHARQPHARPPCAHPHQDASSHGRHHPGAPGVPPWSRTGGRRRGPRRRPPPAAEGGRLTVSPHHRQHQVRHAGHVRRRQRHVVDGADVGDGGADAAPTGAAQAAGRDPPRVRRRRQGSGGEAARPELPPHGDQGDAPAAPAAAAADPAPVREPVPGARLRRAGGSDGDGERVGDRAGHGGVGPRGGGFLAGAVRAVRQGLQGGGLGAHPVRRRPADVPRHGDGASERGARARRAAVPLRPRAASGDGGGGGGHDGGGGGDHVAEGRPHRAGCATCPRAAAGRVAACLRHTLPSFGNVCSQFFFFERMCVHK